MGLYNLNSVFRFTKPERKAVTFTIEKAKTQAESLVFFQERRVISQIIELGCIALNKELDKKAKK